MEAAPPPSHAGNGVQMQPPARWALASLALCMLLAALGTSVANVALPTFAQAFAAGIQQVQWVVLAYLLAITILIVGVGRLGDLIGRRRLLLVGIGLFTAASLLCGLAPSLGLLIVARVLQGLGAAIMMALSMACVGEAVPRARIGSAMGLLGTMSAVGTAMGPTLGGILIAGCGWPAIFHAMVPLGLLAMLLVHRSLPPDRRALSEGISFDLAGTVLLALSLAAYALAVTTGRDGFAPLHAVLLVAAACALGMFIHVESRMPTPLIRLAMFREPLLSAGFASSILVTTVVMATLVVGPFYLSGALGLDAARVGMVMSSGPIVAALVGVPAGRAIDRLGAGGVGFAGLVAMMLGSILLALVPARFGVPGYVAPLVVITAGYALFQAANNTAIMTAISSDQRGVVSGMLNLSRNLGLITGASVMGSVFAVASAAAAAEAPGPEAVAAGMHGAFAIAALLVIIAIVVGSLGRGMAQRGVHARRSESDRGGTPVTQGRSSTDCR